MFANKVGWSSQQKNFNQFYHVIILKVCRVKLKRTYRSIKKIQYFIGNLNFFARKNIADCDIVRYLFEEIISPNSAAFHHDLKKLP